jgi:hypothetical protein
LLLFYSFLSNYTKEQGQKKTGTLPENNLIRQANNFTPSI